MIKKYLVTGGTGFIGRSLVESLVKEGHEVTILDNDSRGSIEKLGIDIKKIHAINGDIRDKDIVEKACQNIDGVIRLVTGLPVEK